MQEIIYLDHPFFNDYVRAFQAGCLKELGDEGREQVYKLSCGLYPDGYLEMKWPGWEIGIPRPDKLVHPGILKKFDSYKNAFTIDFFKKVSNKLTYCELSCVYEKFGEGIEDRIGKNRGLHYNLECAYWTFNIKFNNWINQNIVTYNCSLVCHLDEILARFDNDLRETFFPITGSYKISDRKRKKLQERLLNQLAPALKRPLIEDYWS